jgi:hypothetical protein
VAEEFLLLVDGLFAVAQQAGQVLDPRFEVCSLELLLRPLAAQGIKLGLGLLERGFRYFEFLVQALAFFCALLFLSRPLLFLRLAALQGIFEVGLGQPKAGVLPVVSISLIAGATGPFLPAGRCNDDSLLMCRALPRHGVARPSPR